MTLSPIYKVLDIGCCMGTDVRMLLLDEFTTLDNIIGVDVAGEFLELGFKLYGDGDKMKNVFKVPN